MVFDDLGILECRTYGEADESTWFDLASLTKLFTSTTVLALTEDGKCVLSDTAGSILSDSLLEHPGLYARLSQITLYQLLTHTSGLIPWFPFYTIPCDFYTVLEQVLEKNPQLSGMHYSDLNFMILGKVTEKISGIPIQECMKKYGVLDENEASYFPPGSSLKEKLAEEGKIAISSYGNPPEEKMCSERNLHFEKFRPHDRAVIGEANDGNCWYYFHGISGHAGIFAKSSALVRLGTKYLQARNGLFREAMQEQISGRGLGFQISDVFPDGCGHTGYTGTALWLSPSKSAGAVILANRLAFRDQTVPPDLTDMRREVFRSVNDELSDNKLNAR